MKSPTVKPSPLKAKKQSVKGKPCPPGYNAKRDGCLPNAGQQAPEQPKEIAQPKEEKQERKAIAPSHAELSNRGEQMEKIGNLMRKTLDMGIKQVFDMYLPSTPEHKRDIAFDKDTGSFLKAGEAVSKAVKINLVNEIADKMAQYVDVDQCRRFAEMYSEQRHVGDKKGKKSYFNDAVAVLISKWADTSSDHDALARAVQNRAASVFGLKDFFQYEKSEDGSIEGATERQEIIWRGVIDAYLKATYQHTQDTLSEMGIDELILFRGMQVEDEYKKRIPKKPVLDKDTYKQALGDEYISTFAKDNLLLWVLDARAKDAVENGDVGELMDAFSDANIAMSPGRNIIISYFKKLKTAVDDAIAHADIPTPKKETEIKTEQVKLQPVSSFATSFGSALAFAQNSLSMSGLVMSTKIPREQIFSLCLTGPGCLSEDEVTVLGGVVDAHVMQFEDPTKFNLEAPTDMQAQKMFIDKVEQLEKGSGS